MAPFYAALDLRPLGYRVALVGKTHMAADTAGLARVTPGQPADAQEQAP